MLEREEVKPVEKERGKITVIETDEGFRIEVTGKDLKECFSCCCMPGSSKPGKPNQSAVPPVRKRSRR